VVIAPGYTVSKLLWTREQHPQVFARIAHILLPHDYLNYWLTGRAVANTAMPPAPVTSTCAAANGTRRCSSTSTPAVACKRAVPELIEADQAVGTILPAIAERLGINPAPSSPAAAATT
jgi:xylulokinase